MERCILGIQRRAQQAFENCSQAAEGTSNKQTGRFVAPFIENNTESRVTVISPPEIRGCDTRRAHSCLPRRRRYWRVVPREFDSRIVARKRNRGMMKREIDLSDAAAAEGSRPKRRKEGLGTPTDVDASMDIVVPNEVDEGDQGEPESVKEQGFRLWQIVKDAVNKECVFPALFDPLAFISAILSLLQYSRGRTLSIEFLKKPPKRLYPDYYKIIQKPIALEDIKKQLDHNGYLTLEEVRADFELCFINAKTYNMKESEIWKDAKDLLVSDLNYCKT